MFYIHVHGWRHLSAGVGVCVGVCMYAYVPVWLGFRYSVSFEKLMSDYNQTWVKDAIGVPSYVNEVKDHVPSYVENVKLV